MESASAQTDESDSGRSVEIGGGVEISYLEIDFDGLYQEWLESQHMRTDLRPPIIESPRKIIERHVERKDLSPEIVMPATYAQWTDRRPVEQILKGDEVD